MSEGDTEKNGSTETTNESLLDKSGADLSDGEFFLADGIKGAGDRPEWYDHEHFKSISEQAKSYKELHTKFGSFTGSPKDGYKLPEGIESDDELAKTYTEFAANLNMNQDGFDKGFELLSAQIGVSEKISAENELAKLGDNAQQRIQNIEYALKNKFGDDYDSVRDLVYNADGILLAEAIIKKFAPTRLPIDGGENPTGITWADIETEMMRKDAHGNWLRSVDKDHEAKIQKMMKEYGGDKPDVEIIS